MSWSGILLAERTEFESGTSEVTLPFFVRVRSSSAPRSSAVTQRGLFPLAPARFGLCFTRARFGRR